MSITIEHGNNLDALRSLAADGARFDLVELDGPYMAGLEDWDTLTEDEYVQHYAERLMLVRQVLQPWGVVFVFGYPEGCAEIKAWARQTGTLHLRRWLTWYVQSTTHAGRRVQAILVMEYPKPTPLFDAFKTWLRFTRLQQRMTVKDAMIATGIRADKVTTGERGGGGFLWYEAPSSKLPTPDEYDRIDRQFSIPDQFVTLQTVLNGADSLTDRDFITVPVEKAERVNDAGLRSKPIGLYHDLFRPVVPPRNDKRALVLYGGSGNAAIAAGQLGYDVTVIEQNAARCDLIRRRWAWHVERRDMTPVNEYGPLFSEVIA